MYRHTNVTHNRVISGSRHEVDENCASLRYYTAGSDNFLPTLWDSPPVPSSGLKMGPVGCPETSAINYHYSPRNVPEESSSNPRLLDTQRAIQLFKDVCNTIHLQLAIWGTILITHRVCILEGCIRSYLFMTIFLTSLCLALREIIYVLTA